MGAMERGLHLGGDPWAVAGNSLGPDQAPDPQLIDARTRRRRRRRVLGVLLLALLGISGLGSGYLTLALFTDQETVVADVSTGTIDLDGAKIDALVLTTTGLMPNDTVTDDVVVENDGTAQLRYAMTTSSTNGDAKGLRDVLVLTVKTIDVTTPGTPCDNFDGSGTLYSGVLGTSTARFGDTTPGSQSGDRTLNAGANETLCFRISLPLATGNAYQGAATTTIFTFDAEQTSSNP
jgi:spore coat-associated protein N